MNTGPAPRISKLSSFKSSGSAKASQLAAFEENTESRNRSGSSFRQKVSQIFRPSSRSGTKPTTKLATIQLSPSPTVGKFGLPRHSATLASLASDSDLKSQRQKSNTDGKNIQRIRLKKKSEPFTITPLQIQSSKVPDLLLKQKSTVAMGSATEAIQNTNFSQRRRGTIYPTDKTPIEMKSDSAGNAASPDIKAKKFIGKQGTGFEAISMIKQDKIGLPG